MYMLDGITIDPVEETPDPTDDGEDEDGSQSRAS
jgi:hypothetical protein